MYFLSHSPRIFWEKSSKDKDTYVFGISTADDHSLVYKDGFLGFTGIDSIFCIWTTGRCCSMSY